jgi:hypothetical protein
MHHVIISAIQNGITCLQDNTPHGPHPIVYVDSSIGDMGSELDISNEEWVKLNIQGEGSELANIFHGVS